MSEEMDKEKRRKEYGDKKNARRLVAADYWNIWTQLAYALSPAKSEALQDQYPARISLQDLKYDHQGKQN